MKTVVKITALLKWPLSLEPQRCEVGGASQQRSVILARTCVELRTPSSQIFIWAVNTFLNTHHAVSKNKRYFEKKTSAQVVGTSGSQKSCMVCFYGTTSQGTFRLGQLQISICDDTWLKKKNWLWAQKRKNIGNGQRIKQHRLLSCVVQGNMKNFSSLTEWIRKARADKEQPSVTRATDTHSTYHGAEALCVLLMRDAQPLRRQHQFLFLFGRW